MRVMEVWEEEEEEDKERLSEVVDVVVVVSFGLEELLFSPIMPKFVASISLLDDNVVCTTNKDTKDNAIIIDFIFNTPIGNYLYLSNWEILVNFNRKVLILLFSEFFKFFYFFYKSFPVHIILSKIT